MSFRLVPNSVILDDIELRNFTEFGRIQDGLHKSGWRYTDTFCGRNVGQRITF